MNSVEQIKQKLDMDLFVRVAQEKAKRNQAEIIPFSASKGKEASRVDLRQSDPMFSSSKVKQILWQAFQGTRDAKRAKMRY